jgi:hypothetical protein
LLASDVGGERHSPDVGENHAPADDTTASEAPRPQPGDGLRRRP